MNLYLLSILPFVSTLICGITAYVCCRYMQSKFNAIIKRVIDVPLLEASTPNFSKTWDEGLLDQQLEKIIKIRLNALVEGFKQLIPMVSMFLSQSREDKLKEEALTELLKAIPEIKQTALQHMSTPNLYSNEKVEANRLHSFLVVNQKFWQAWTRFLCGIALIFGLLIGCFEAGMFYLLLAS